MITEKEILELMQVFDQKVIIHYSTDRQCRGVCQRQLKNISGMIMRSKGDNNEMVEEDDGEQDRHKDEADSGANSDVKAQTEKKARRSFIGAGREMIFWNDSIGDDIPKKKSVCMKLNLRLLIPMLRAKSKLRLRMRRRLTGNFDRGLWIISPLRIMPELKLVKEQLNQVKA
jgi:hypothetical protein